MLCERAVSERQLEARGAERERGARRYLLRREVAQPFRQNRGLPVAEQLRRGLPQQRARALEVVRVDGMLDRGRALSLQLVPLAGTRVQRCLELGLAQPLLCTQRLCEQPVIAVLRVGAVEWDD